MEQDFMMYSNFNVDINNKGLSFLVYGLDDQTKYSVEPGLNKGFQMTGALIEILKDNSRFPDVEIVNMNLELTGTEALSRVDPPKLKNAKASSTNVSG